MAAGQSGELYASAYARAYNDNIKTQMFSGVQERAITAFKWMDVRPGGDQPFEHEALWKSFGSAPVHYGNAAIEFRAPAELGDIKANYREFWLGFATDYTFTTKRGTREKIPDLAKMVGRSINSTARGVGAEVFNQAFSTTYPTAADTAALISASHTSDGGTVNNLVTGNPPLNRTSLEDALTILYTTQDWANNDLDLPAGTLLVGGGINRFRGSELLFTTNGKVETAVNDRNVFQDENIQLLTETAAVNTARWMLIAATGFHSARLFMEAITPFGPGMDEKTGTYFASLRTALTWLVQDWRGFVGSNPT